MSFFNFKNLAMTSSMTSSFPKSGGFIYSLLPMYTVSFKFVQALLLFKIAGESSQGKKNTRKKRKTKKNITITIVVWLLAEHLITEAICLQSLNEFHLFAVLDYCLNVIIKSLPVQLVFEPYWQHWRCMTQDSQQSDRAPDYPAIFSDVALSI